MINVTLKVKHYRLIAYLLKNKAAEEVIDILSVLKQNVTSSLDDSEEVTVTIDSDSIIKVYPLLSNLKEGEAAEINKEMDYMLRPQVEEGLSKNEDEWIHVGSFIYNHKQDYQKVLQTYINRGKDFLNGNN